MDNYEIKIYYRWCELDKQHQYGIVCNFRGSQQFSNYWIYWLWYRMGEGFTKKEKKQFKISAYNCGWDEKEKLIKLYKTVNDTFKVILAIRNHFRKLKK